VLAEARRDADSSDVTVETVTTTADNAGAQICVEAEGRGADLVVLGTTVRRVDDHPFLGHTVTHVLEQLTEPTVVVVVLPDAQQAAAEEHIDRAAG
jgi:nucleotide-binding universal stress UspA family protein